MSGVDFDLTLPEGYGLTTPLVPEPEPEEPDVRYTIDLGLLGPTYDDATDAPLTAGRWYVDDAARSVPFCSIPLHSTAFHCIPLLCLHYTLSLSSRYMDDATQNPPRSYEVPHTPLYHTKGTCGVKDTPVINVPENATTVEVVLHNLSPAAHVLHMHGMPFKVINVANFTSWCGLESVSCFGLPWWSPFGVFNGW